MKRIASFIVCSVAALLTSCNINVDMQNNNKPDSDPTAIGFGVYMNRGVTTKAGYAGELTTDTLKKATVGFGVFGYYGNGAMYNETMKPDFMYNQWVKFTSNNVWEYSPIKYWPNEFGQAAGNEVADRLTFFAYAPYVEVTPSTGIVTDANDEDGILGMTRNISAGDPQVMYGARLQPGGGVDLCWGVAASDFTSSVDGNNNKVDKGKPFINLIKPKTGDKIAFEFNHALSQLNVQIDADIDVESHAASSLDTKTRIYVRSVTFTGFALRGSLNLNSEAGKPVWSDISGTGRLRRDPVTIYDGRSDGLEGVATAVDLNETPATLSPMIIQSSPFDIQNLDGVTNTPVNLFSYADPTNPVAAVNDPIMVIPIAGVPLTVTIVYDIETKDPNLAGYLSDGVTRGISIENKITKSIQLNDGSNMTLEAGKKYVIGLHLGLTSVKFDAQVANWDNEQHEGSAYLPVNTASIAGITLTPTSTTAWLGDGQIDLPAYEVKNADNTDITASSTVEWSTVENPEVASYDATSGKIKIKDVGVAKIRATATYNGQSATADYTVNVNVVTGVSIDPASGDFTIGTPKVFTATLTLNTPINGTIAAEDMPVVTWTHSNGVLLSADSSRSTADGTNAIATTTASTTTSAAAGNTVGVRAKVASRYTGTGEQSALATLTFVPDTPTLGYFRGYDISTGILKRSDTGIYSLTGGSLVWSAGTYSLPEGSNPFELYTYYGVDANLNKYYFSWSSLKSELGNDGDNIDVNSDKLPTYSGSDRWMMPSDDDWESILSGAPLLAITVGNTTISTTDQEMAWALVTVTDNANKYYGVMLLRDGTSIPAGLLEEDSLGSDCRGFDDNDLNMDQFNQLIAAGCLFISCSGEYNNVNNWIGMKDSAWDDEGHYWSGSNQDNDTMTAFYMTIDSYYGASAGANSTYSTYYPVRLVKKIN